MNNMSISELSIGQGNVDVEGTIKEIGEVKSFNKFGKELKVANAVLEDDTGSIKLTLWNDDVDKFKEGDKIKIVNGYVNEFQGESQLTSGKYGQIEKAGESEQTELEETPKSEEEAPAEEAPSEEETAEETPAEDTEEETSKVEEETII
jgi:replication factor A1